MATDDLATALVEAVATAPGAGVARVDRAGVVLAEAAWGLADRRLAVPMTASHRLAMASGSKGFTALAVMSLVVEGRLALETTARSLLGADLPLVDHGVTIADLLAHRSGVGEYLDDDADPGEYVLSIPVHRLVSPEEYLPMLDGHPQLFRPGTRFAYSNAGFILLAILAQRAADRPFHDLVRERVIEPGGLADTAYLRSDDLPADAALGYVEIDGQWRSNVLHLPVVGGGDGGAYTSLADLGRFWRALQAGRIVPTEAVARMTAPTSEDEGGWHYGLGFWLRPGDGVVALVGEDAGVSFRSTHVVADDLVASVIGTTADAAWPVTRALDTALGIRRG
ncbi:MAG: serine hydrolase domain-containing protein [Propionicimonas sp.]|nr:serine hydrolase domain-containing protein [Propionicimonas sp.]